MKRSVFATMTLLPGLAMAHLSNMPAVEHAAEHAGTLLWLLPILLVVVAALWSRRSD